MTKNASTNNAVRGLNDLAQIQIQPDRESAFDAACIRNGGSAAWQARKMSEGKDLFRLERLTGRLFVHHLDLTGDLHALIEMRAPVPRMPHPTGGLKIAHSSLLALVYRHEAIYLPQPGTSFINVLAPQAVWHPNVGTGGGHVPVLCLGPLLPPGFPVKHILLLTYISLTMTAVQFDALDPAGVLNHDAATWWQHNTRLLPLSNEPFVAPHQEQPGP